MAQTLTPKTQSPLPESSQPTIYSGMKVQSDFHVHSNQIANRLLSTRGVSFDEALSMNQELEAWSLTLPSYFQLQGEVPSTEQWYLFARSRLWWRFWNLKIVLFRQILLRRAVNSNGHTQTFPLSAGDDKCRDICIDAAHSTILSIHSFLEQCELTRLVGWYAM